MGTALGTPVCTCFLIVVLWVGGMRNIRSAYCVRARAKSNLQTATRTRALCAISERITATDDPVIVRMQKLLKKNPAAVSLAQGVVYWTPPSSAVARVIRACESFHVHKYCADDGLPELRSALKEKLARENNLRSESTEVMVTSGANQAFVNLVLALVDSDDEVVLFPPYYFNHLMALQMTGGSARVVLGCVDEKLVPNMKWFEEYLRCSQGRVKMCVLVNPCNPTGILYSHTLLQEARAVCEQAHCWLVVDNTYEHFTYGSAESYAHSCVEGPNVVNVFSFSKAFGMMGWRVGYIAYPAELRGSILKAQDTIPICTAIASQEMALGALEAGRGWVCERVQSLQANKEAAVAALQPLLQQGARLYGGSGAIYLLCTLPPCVREDVPRLFEALGTVCTEERLDWKEADQAVCDWLALEHDIVVLPGSSCGYPDSMRVCYANLPLEECAAACQKLQRGLQDLLALLR